MILVHSNINYDLITKLNSKFELKMKSNFKNVKTNVAIAAAAEGAIVSHGPVPMRPRLVRCS
jgi:hypothetical protein